MTTVAEHLERLYASFNARDIEDVLAAMHDEVVWANGLEGGYVYGREGVRDYWTRQWAAMDSRAVPLSFSVGEDGIVEAEVHVTAHDHQGAVLFDAIRRHVFELEDGRVK